MFSVGLAGGVAEDLAPAPGDEEPVRAGRREALKPLPPLGDGDRLGGQGGVRVHDRAVKDAHDRRQVVFAARLDDDRLRAGECSRASWLMSASIPSVSNRGLFGWLSPTFPLPLADISQGTTFRTPDVRRKSTGGRCRPRSRRRGQTPKASKSSSARSALRVNVEVTGQSDEAL